MATDTTGPTDPYAEWDAAYVLGALTHDQRTTFEDHLSTCARCRAAVAELAVIPQFLAAAPREIQDQSSPPRQKPHQ
ncbi:anti-sigma factor family protein [Rhodococcus erythropolis]